MKLNEFRKVGEHFMFMGVSCIVTRLVTDHHYEGIGMLPGFMLATYVDCHGKFQTREFREDELPALINENPDNISAVSLTREDILDVLMREHDELIAKNATVGLSMQGGYNDGVRDLFHKLHRRLI